MKTLNKTAQVLIAEIHSTMMPKFYNIQNNVATTKEKQIVSECQGFLSLIKFSSLSTKEIKRLWEESSLKYM